MYLQQNRVKKAEPNLNLNATDELWLRGSELDTAESKSSVQNRLAKFLPFAYHVRRTWTVTEFQSKLL